MTLPATQPVSGRKGVSTMPSEPEALAVFLGMGSGVRTLNKVREKFLGEQPPRQISIKTLKRWSSKSGWVKQAEDHDKAAVERTRQKMTEQQAKEAANAAQALGIDAHYVLKNLKETAERCMQAVPVLDEEGEETGVYRFDSKGAIAALKAMGVEIGMFRPPPDAPPTNTPPGHVTNNNTLVLVSEVQGEVAELLKRFDPLSAKGPKIDG